MSDDEVLQLLIGYFADHAPPGERVDASTPLRDPNLIDSRAITEAALFIEQQFDLALDRSDLDRCETPADVADLIHDKRNAA